MEIINISTEGTLPIWLTALVVVALSVAFVCGTMATFAPNNVSVSVIAASLIACLIVMLIMVLAKEEHKRYEVRVSDKAYFKEIMERYDVIEIHDDLYILEEKK